MKPSIRSFLQRRSATGKALVAIVLAATVLASCRSSDLGVDTRSNNQTPRQVGEQQLPANPSGDVIGTGSVRVAFLIPSSVPGGLGNAAAQLKNGATLAMNDFGNDTLQVVFKDTAGQPANAQQVTTQAVQERASVIIGPLLAGNVSAAAGVAQPSGLTILGFSTNTSVARRGVYLLNYTPQADTRRILTYAISRGSKSILAFLPRTAEGNLRESVLREVAGGSGINTRIIKYDQDTASIRTAVGEAAANFGGFDTIYIPDGREIPGVLLGTLKDSRLDYSSKTILGSGQWESVNKSDPNVAGAIYPGRDVTNFNEFARNYQARFGSQAGVLAGLGYDAITLAAELVRRRGSSAFSSQTLENRRGYAGVNGVFRLRSDGTAERGLAIYKIEGGRGRVESPAPNSFSGT